MQLTPICAKNGIIISGKILVGFHIKGCGTAGRGLET